MYNYNTGAISLLMSTQLGILQKPQKHVLYSVLMYTLQYNVHSKPKRFLITSILIAIIEWRFIIEKNDRDPGML